MEPTLISSPASAWQITDARTARADCRGPNVLNGRRMITGIPYVRWKLIAMLSVATLLAAYGDCGCSGCVSGMGTRCAESVDLAGRSLHKPFNVHLARHEQGVHGGDNVVEDRVLRVLVRVWNSHERGQVEHHLAILHDPTDCIDVRKLDTVYLHGAPQLGVGVMETALVTT